MDIPTPDTVTIYARTGEGIYGPAFGAGASVRACVQETITRMLDGNGDDIVSDLLVILSPGVNVKTGDALLYSGRWFDVLGVERFGLPLPAGAHHVELLCKTRAEPVG